MKFRTTILQAGKTATGIRIPDEIVEALGQGKRPPVLITINDHTYRNAVAVMGGAFMVSVSAENRAAAGVAGGDEVDVEIELDTKPRVAKVPPDLADALARDNEAARTFDGLTDAKKRRLVHALEEAKTPETRQRRLDNTLTSLSADRT
jgi:hypothetical protein